MWGRLCSHSGLIESGINGWVCESIGINDGDGLGKAMCECFEMLRFEDVGRKNEYV